MGMINVKKPEAVSTAAVVATGLIGGWLTARESGIRPLGAVVLGAAGGWAVRSWKAKTNVPTTVGLSALYVAAFGGSHPLAKRIGAWPAVLTVTAVAAGAAYALSDAR